MAAIIVTPKWGEGIKEDCQNLSEKTSNRSNPVDAFEPLHLEALRKCLESIEETVGRLNAITMQAPCSGQWNQVRGEVSCLDSIGDVMRQAPDVLEGRWIGPPDA